MIVPSPALHAQEDIYYHFMSFMRLLIILLQQDKQS